MGNPDGFDFWAEHGNGRAGIGETLRLSGKAHLRATLPSTAEIVIVHNGKVIQESKNSVLDITIDKPGIYRLEAWHGKHGWIFSNHIRVVS